jgi:DNA ligase-1
MNPMLATATDGTNLTYPLLASPKLDGVRCVNINGHAVSRNLKPIPNRHTQRLFSKIEFNGLDGELIVGPLNDPAVFQTTISGVMSVAGKPNISLWVFDTHLSDRGFKDRLELVEQQLIKHWKDSSVRVVPHELIHSEVELLTFEQSCLKAGYEGIMLRDPNGPYKHGRSTLKEGWLLKLKRFVDAEAWVIGVRQLMHNSNASTTNALGQRERSSHKAGKIPLLELGALLVRDCKTGVEFEVGTGFTHVQRVELWQQRRELIGKLAKYKFQPIGVKDKPRFPVFLGFRDARDL